MKLSKLNKIHMKLFINYYELNKLILFNQFRFFYIKIQKLLGK